MGGGGGLASAEEALVPPLTCVDGALGASVSELDSTKHTAPTDLDSIVLLDMSPLPFLVGDIV